MEEREIKKETETKDVKQRGSLRQKGKGTSK